MHIQCNPANPVEYLASLGIFAIASRLDPLIEGKWGEEGFELQGIIPETELVGLIQPVLTDFTRWKFDRKDGAAYQVKVDFGSFLFPLNWWYDSVNDLEKKRRFANSNWKLFAANQSVWSITRDLIKAVAEGLPTDATLTDLVCFRAEVTGRFGFDPLASKHVLDAGYSPDNLRLPVLTSVAAELLSLFAIQVFFPPRCGIRARGWIKSEAGKLGFGYCVWEDFLPLPPARVAAVCTRNQMLFSAKRNRAQFGNLSPARMPN